MELITPRLFLISTPLHVIKMRLQRDDFTADVSVAGQTLSVHFPPEWPGDAAVLLPVWEKNFEDDPRYEMWGGTMIDRAELVAVGQMTLNLIPDQAGVAELGYGVNPAFQDKGYATEAAMALVRWAAEEPRITRITAACREDNLPSLRVLEKVGFHRAGSRVDEEGPMILWECL